MIARKIAKLQSGNVRRRILAAAIFGFLCALNCAAQTVETLLAFDAAKGEFAENLTVDSAGNVFVTLLQARDIVRFAPDKTVRRVHLPIGDKATVTGIVFDNRQRLFVAVNSANADEIGVWSVDFDGENFARVAALPIDSMLNGITADASGNLFVAESKRGAIWRVRADLQTTEKWLEHRLIAARPQAVRLPDGKVETLNVGANGLHFLRNELYISVSGQATIVRVSVLPNGAAGKPKIFLKKVFTDDFAFDTNGELFLTANHESILTAKIERVTKRKKFVILADAKNDLQQPSAIAFDRSGAMYLTNLGLFGATQKPSLQKLKIAR